MKLDLYSKILILALVILGFFLLFTPSVLSEPNFQGLPTIPLGLFALASVLYCFLTNHRNWLYVTIIILLILSGYTGFWAYSYKIPLSSLEVSIQIDRFRVFHIDPSSSSYHSGNASSWTFNLTIQNPTNLDTPPFNFEDSRVYIDNLKLNDGYTINWEVFGYGVGRDGQGYYYPQIVIKAHESLTINGPWIIIYEDSIQVEGDNHQDVWAHLVGRNFVFGMSGNFNSRPNFKIGDDSRQSLWILAQSSFMASKEFNENL